MKFRSQDTASRRAVKLWLFVWADIHYPQQSIWPLPLQHWLVPWQSQECRNVAPGQAGGEKMPLTWRIPALSMSASFIQHFTPFEVGASPCCPQLLLSLLHLPFSHSQPGWSCWVCALWAGQDVATERANVGKARAWLYVHNSKSVSVHRLRIPQCLS